MWEEFFKELTKSISMLALLLLFMLGIAYILQYKMAHIFHLLKVGSKKELTTYHGRVSLATIVIISVFAGSIIFINEVSTLFSFVFDYDLHDMGSPILIALFSIIVMSIINFIFLGFMYWVEKKY